MNLIKTRAEGSAGYLWFCHLQEYHVGQVDSEDVTWIDVA